VIAYSYVYGADANIASNSGYSVSGLHAGGKAITASGFAGGFVYENTGTISNSYSNIWVKGAGAGFAYKNETETSVIEYCYSLSSMRINDSTTYPFTNKNMASTGVLNKGTVKDCFYLFRCLKMCPMKKERHCLYGAVPFFILSIQKSTY